MNNYPPEREITKFYFEDGRDEDFYVISKEELEKTFKNKLKGYITLEGIYSLDRVSINFEILRTLNSFEGSLSLRLILYIDNKIYISKYSQEIDKITNCSYISKYPTNSLEFIGGNHG